MSSASADGASTHEDGGPTTDWQVALCVICLQDAVDVDAVDVDAERGKDLMIALRWIVGYIEYINLPFHCNNSSSAY